LIGSQGKGAGLMQNVNKEKVVCAAAIGLLVMTAYVLTADAFKPKRLTGYPTAGGVRLRGPEDVAVDPQAFARFWNFGPRNPFQPVINRNEPTDSAKEHHDVATADRPDHTDKVEIVAQGNVGNPDRQLWENATEAANHGDTGEKDFEMPLILQGTIKIGESCALLEDAQTGSLTRCTIGDTLRGMTVRGISPTSVIVQDSNGNLHELLDAFRRRYD